MEATDKNCENEKKLLPFIPEENLSENPYKSINLWKRFSHALFAFALSYFAFLYFSHPSPPQAKPYLEAYLNQITNISMELNRKAIQASSLHDQYFPLLVSQKIQDLEPPSEASVDLLCVFDFTSQYRYWSHKEKTEHVRHRLKTTLPKMNTQDRLSVVLLQSLQPEGQNLCILPFPNVTETILSAVGANILRGNASQIRGGGKAAWKVLNRRNGTNQTTGIFFFTHFHERNMRDLNYLKQYFGLDNQGVIIEEFSTNYLGLSGGFVESLNVLRTGVVENQFMIKPEGSHVLRGVRLASTLEKDITRAKWVERLHEENTPFVISNEGLKLDVQEEFLVYLKIPRIVRLGSSLKKNSMEVKVATCQQIFKLRDGSQVVKNFDLTVKIVGEEEEFIDEEEEKKVAKEFERKLGEDWLPFSVMFFDENGNYKYSREVLRKFYRI